MMVLALRHVGTGLENAEHVCEDIRELLYTGSQYRTRNVVRTCACQDVITREKTSKKGHPSSGKVW